MCMITSISRFIIRVSASNIERLLPPLPHGPVAATRIPLRRLPNGHGPPPLAAVNPRCSASRHKANCLLLERADGRSPGVLSWAARECRRDCAAQVQMGDS